MKTESASVGLAALPDEELNVKIAGWCGWKRENAAKFFARKYPKKYDLNDPRYKKFTLAISPNDENRAGTDEPTDEWFHSFIPHYCSDLNAMHEAEMTLNETEQCIYLDRLDEIVPHGDEISEEGYVCHSNALFQFATATAHHRAEAFVATMSPVQEKVKSKAGVGVVAEGETNPAQEGNQAGRE